MQYYQPDYIKTFIHEIDNNGNTPLHIASTCAFEDMIVLQL